MKRERLKAQEQVEELEHGGDGSGDTPSRGPLPSWNLAPPRIQVESGIRNKLRLHHYDA